jgi:tetratricopeptide (TPR) repeat protein
MMEADWLSRRGLALAPDWQLAWQARAMYLDRSGDLAGALKAMQRGSNLTFDHPSFRRTWARMLERAGRIEDAIQALTSDDQNYRGFFESLSERAELLKRAGRFTEAKLDFLALNQIPPRAPVARSNLVDLTLFYTAGLGTDPSSSSFSYNTLSESPRGVLSLSGVEYDFRGLVQLSSSRVGQTFPERIEDIPVNLRCRRIHFIHAADAQAPDGTRIGTYSLRYADGKSAEISIIYGQDLCAWDLDKPRETSPPVVAWRGRNRVRTCVQLFRTTWENPRANMEIKSLDLVSAMTHCAPFVVAITAE